ncbi:fibrillarin-like rRNA/tRNA 2'-O-methyltransferase [Candidatus Woesearchaeota archaeon]|nr:fibrillarin-like rRNA/tRNA 2'-O-methyltransferase [Candidatus Woesearchaeota archaeon]
MKQSRFHRIYEKGKRRKKLFTKNLTPGKTVYDESVINENNLEYREWNPKRSKLAASILKGINKIGIEKGSIVLYLGASSGTTVSHVSDIVGEEGFVFAVEFAPRMMRDLVFVCEDRKNIAPMLYDANKPEEYKDKMTEKVDIVYMDIAQRNQAEIFLKNVDMFLKKEGVGLLAVKARSVNVVEKPFKIFKQVREKLERNLNVIDYKLLSPFQKDHCMFVVKKWE